jgi:tRNA-uridine 2-sulfurtransferase
LRQLAMDVDLVCNMADFPGPYVLAPYGSESAMAAAAALCVRYSDAPADTEASVVCLHKNKSTTIKAKAIPKEDSERWII